MAGRGRPPKPTAIKELEGNPGKRTLNKNEPKPEKKAPKCPSWLEPDAKKEWRRLSKELTAMGLLTQVDMAAFAGYCQAYARWKEAEEFISKHGSILKTSSGYIQQIPQVSIAQQNLKQVRNFCSEMGLSPSARSRLNINSLGNTIDGDEMEELLLSIPKAEDLMGRPN
ncbi:phage terminase small subunit P27 family [Virgibacillus sp. DJP39]|uniref:phage terminase small subunit P27 family n=1 Tax=Virgibacillus sp. DJP39 TaxID=3409790 RepID=UPI003BB7B29E